RDLAQDGSQDAWIRSAAAFWGARAATALGQGPVAAEQLRIAAQAPQTFYGMIAARELKARTATAQAPQLVLAAFTPGAEGTDFVAKDPRAHRAAALAQIGRLQAAAQEL